MEKETTSTNVQLNGPQGNQGFASANSSTIVKSNHATSRVIQLFERVKEIYRNSTKVTFNFESAEQEVISIQNEFRMSFNFQGEFFCLKALKILYEKRGDLSLDIDDKVLFYEKAHGHINEAVLRSLEKRTTQQPSLPKHQARIKSKLGDTLHLKGDHHNGNLLIGQALKILGQLVAQFPDYPEAHIELATVSFLKLKWSLGKINFNLEKAHNLFNHPIHRKHVAEDAERKGYESMITNLKATVAEIQRTVQVQNV